MEDRATVVMAFAWTPDYVDGMDIDDLHYWAKMGKQRIKLMGRGF